MLGYLGCALIYAGSLLLLQYFDNRLDKKMENQTGYKIEVKTLHFGAGFTDENGKPLTITYLGPVGEPVGEKEGIK